MTPEQLLKHIALLEEKLNDAKALMQDMDECITEENACRS